MNYFFRTFLVCCVSFLALKTGESESAAAVGITWPVKRIPYAFSNIIEFGFDSRDHITHTLNRMQESLSVNGKRCVEFVPREKNEKDYILFYDGGDCSSSIGYQTGKNRISLARGCRAPGTVMHEMLHRLGFDHEHSRYDRDQYIKINEANAKNKHNFAINLFSSERMSEKTPYDFYSITHYNSDSMQIDPEVPTITSRIRALISNDKKLFHSRDSLSPIDIYKIQKLYDCDVLTIPKTRPGNETLDELLLKTKKINARFHLEASFHKTTTFQVREEYLKKNYLTCGLDYFWPADYPIVDSKDPLYNLICIRKKKVNEPCKFSIECKDGDAACVRVFFKKTGFCMRLFKDPKLNKINQKINDKMFEAGKWIKNKPGAWIKNIFG